MALSLSVVEWFDPDICQQLVGAHADEVVRQLLARGVFLTVVDRRTGAMRFHAHFRELMEMELGWRDPARRIDLHRRAAMLWRERGDLMSAYRHLSAIGDSGKAHDVLVGRHSSWYTAATSPHSSSLHTSCPSLVMSTTPTSLSIWPSSPISPTALSRRDVGAIVPRCS